MLLMHYLSIDDINYKLLKMSMILISDETVAHGPQKRKIELCKSYTETGLCGYGENCFFAHGVE